MKNSFSNQALKFILIQLLSGTMMMISCDNNKKTSSTQPAKIYVANEEGGSISLIDLQDSLKKK